MSFLGNMLANGAYFKHSRGDYAEAKKMYESAIQKGVTKPERLTAYGVLLMREGNYEEAIKMFDSAIRLKPNQTVRLKTRMNRAVAYTKVGEIDKARAALEQIHQKFRSARAYEALGYFYVITDDPKAEEYNLEALDYDDSNYVVLDNLCQYYIGKGDYKTARDYGEKAYQLEKDKVDILYHLAIIEAHDKNMDKAKKYCEAMMDAPLTGLSDITDDKRRKTYKNIVGVEYESEQIDS